MRVLLPVDLWLYDPQFVITARIDAEPIPQRRGRDGGKSPAAKLLRSVKPKGKRAAFLRWFLEDPTGRTVGATMANFNMTRQNVFAYWTMIHRDHGIGYALSNNTLASILPADCNSESVFKQGD